MRQHIKRAYTTSMMTTTTTTMLTVTTRDGLIEFHYMSPMYKTLFTKFTQFSIFPNFLWMWIFCCCFYCKHWTTACPCSLPCHSFIVHVHRLTFSLILSVAKEKWICAFRWHQLHVVSKGETDQLRHAEHARMRICNMLLFVNALMAKQVFQSNSHTLFQKWIKKTQATIMCNIYAEIVF